MIPLPLPRIFSRRSWPWLLPATSTNRTRTLPTPTTSKWVIPYVCWTPTIRTLQTAVWAFASRMMAPWWHFLPLSKKSWMRHAKSHIICSIGMRISLTHATSVGKLAVMRLQSRCAAVPAIYAITATKHVKPSIGSGTIRNSVYTATRCLCCSPLSVLTARIHPVKSWVEGLSLKCVRDSILCPLRDAHSTPRARCVIMTHWWRWSEDEDGVSHHPVQSRARWNRVHPRLWRVSLISRVCLDWVFREDYLFACDSIFPLIDVDKYRTRGSVKRYIISAAHSVLLFGHYMSLSRDAAPQWSFLCDRVYKC